MPPQITANDLSAIPFAPGQPIGPGIDLNAVAAGKTEKVVEVTVSTAADSTAYAVTAPRVDGTTTSKSVNSGTGATKTSIRDLIINALAGDPNVAGRVVAFSSAADKLKVAGFEPGDDFPFSEADANLALNVTQAASAGEAIPFGVGVMAHPTLTWGVRLPVASGTFRGVALRSPSVESEVDGTVAHKAGTGLPLRTHGLVCVPLDDGFTPALGDDVYLRYTADANGQRGWFRGDADTDEALAVADAHWWAAGAFAGLGGKRVGLLYLGRA